MDDMPATGIQITEKNPREIVLLRGSGCVWKKCTFCDYHFDASPDASENFALNHTVLSHVTGEFGRLEVINSGSFCDFQMRRPCKVLSGCVRTKRFR